MRALYQRDGQGALYPMTRYTITDLDDFLAHLHKIREQGYAIADEELELGLWGVAVPLTNAGGDRIAALGASVPRAREPELAQILPRLRECATTISIQL